MTHAAHRTTQTKRLTSHVKLSRSPRKLLALSADYSTATSANGRFDISAVLVVAWIGHRDNRRGCRFVLLCFSMQLMSDHIIPNICNRDSSSLRKEVGGYNTIRRPNASLTSRTSFARSLNIGSRHQRLIVGCLYIPSCACCHCSSTSMAYTLQQRGFLAVTWGTKTRRVRETVRRSELEPPSPNQNTAKKSDGDIGR